MQRWRRFGDEVRRLRGEESIRHFCRRIRCLDASVLSRIERGVRAPSPATVRILDRELGACGRLIALAAETTFDNSIGYGHDARTESGGHLIRSGTTCADVPSDCAGDQFGMYAWEEVDDEVKRREFGKLAAAGSAATLVPHTRIGMQEAQQLSAIVDEFVHRDQCEGGDSLVEAAQRVYTHARTVLETHDFDERTGAAFASATGRMAVRLGWIAYDTADHGLAHRCYRDALALAAEAGDDALAAHACLTSALQMVKLHRPENPSARHALRLAGRARDLTGRLPSGRIHALVAMRAAKAFAALDDRGGFGRSMAAAWREMDRAAEHEPIEQCPPWLRFVSHAEVRFHEATGEERLGNSGTAIDIYADVLSQASGPRNTANYRAVLAGAMARAGDAAGAVAEALPLFDVLGRSVSSTRTVRELAAVRAITGHEEFTARYDHLAGATA
jgi:hypothetical protein